MTRHRFFAAPLLAAVALILFASPATAADLVGWVGYDEALKRSASDGRPVFINFYANWCGFCKKMDAETFTSKKVITALNENFHPVRINADKNPKIRDKYYVRGLPTNVFAQPSGEPISIAPGYVPPDSFAQMLGYISSKAYEKMGFREYLKQ